MDKIIKPCYRCGFFDRYYTKETNNFKQTNLGWCIFKGANTTSCETCPNYKTKKLVQRGSIQLSDTLNDILTQITVVRQIFEEEHNDRNNQMP